MKIRRGKECTRMDICFNTTIYLTRSCINMESENLLKIHNKYRVSSNINLKSKIFKTCISTKYMNIYFLRYQFGKPALPRLLIVTPAVYSHLVLNYDFYYFSIKKSTHLTQNLKTKLRTFPWFSRVPQTKFEANRLLGF